MKGEKQIIERLNEALFLELGAVNHAPSVDPASAKVDTRPLERIVDTRSK